MCIHAFWGLIAKTERLLVKTHTVTNLLFRQYVYFARFAAHSIILPHCEGELQTDLMLTLSLLMNIYCVLCCNVCCWWKWCRDSVTWLCPWLFSDMCVWAQQANLTQQGILLIPDCVGCILYEIWLLSGFMIKSNVCCEPSFIYLIITMIQSLRTILCKNGRETKHFKFSVTYLYIFKGVPYTENTNEKGKKEIYFPSVEKFMCTSSKVKCKYKGVDIYKGKKL